MDNSKNSKRKIIIGAGILALVFISSLGFLMFKSMGGSYGLGKMKKWANGETLLLDIETKRVTENKAGVKAGKAIYKTRCVVCHGIKGDGNGPKAGRLKIPPTDFTSDNFKFRSTLGLLPNNLDIFKSISRGLHGTGMLPWPGLTTTEKWQLVYYLKTFSNIFEDGDIPKSVSIPAPQMSRPQYLAAAKKIYKKASCHECHGFDGKGDGTKAGKLKDYKQRKISPRNFRDEMLKRGINIEDIYLTIATGLNGTPMEGYSKTLSRDEMLALAHYIQSWAVKPSGKRLINGLLEMTDEEKTGIMIDHIMMPTVFRTKYFAWMF